MIGSIALHPPTCHHHCVTTSTLYQLDGCVFVIWVEFSQCRLLKGDLLASGHVTMLSLFAIPPAQEVTWRLHYVLPDHQHTL